MTSTPYFNTQQDQFGASIARKLTIGTTVYIMCLIIYICCKCNRQYFTLKIQYNEIIVQDIYKDYCHVHLLDPDIWEKGYREPVYLQDFLLH